MKRYLLLAFFTAAPLALLTTGCPKVTIPFPEAGVIDAAVDTDTGTVAVVADDGGIEAAAPLTVVTPHATVHVAPGGPFQGTFKCFNNMTTQQTGSVVVAHVTNGTMTCTVSGDICDGHVVTTTNGKTENRHASFKKNGAGDLTYTGAGEPQPTFCKKE